MGTAALLLVFAGYQFRWLDKVDAQLSALATPFYWLAGLPERVSHWADDNLATRAELQIENERLRAEALLLQGKTQKLAALEAENVRLRELLNSSALVDDEVRVAELLLVSPDPLRHEVVIDKGADDSVYVGQPVVDAIGLMGQVIEVGGGHSRVLLITDATHALSVQVNRNGVRSIAEGTGRLDELQLRHVAATTDIRVGDLLVSSGLDQRFPVGYPVAVVTEVTIDPGQSFAVVKAMPSAQLDRSRHVLLVFAHQNKPAGP